MKGRRCYPPVDGFAKRVSFYMDRSDFLCIRIYQPWTWPLWDEACNIRCIHRNKLIQSPRHISSVSISSLYLSAVKHLKKFHSLKLIIYCVSDAFLAIRLLNYHLRFSLPGCLIAQLWNSGVWSQVFGFYSKLELRFKAIVLKRPLDNRRFLAEVGT